MIQTGPNAQKVNTSNLLNYYIITTIIHNQQKNLSTYIK